MDSKSHLRRINVKGAAKEGRQWNDALERSKDASVLISHFPRLSQDTHEGHPIEMLQWSAHFKNKADAAGQHQVWLHLTAKAVLPLTCQRCLEEALISFEVDRWFRFEHDENSAAAQDDVCEEDVLAMDQDLDLFELIEDELLMAIPMIPTHDVCPTDVQLRDNETEGFADDVKVHPFAVLSGLNRSGSGG